MNSSPMPTKRTSPTSRGLTIKIRESVSHKILERYEWLLQPLKARFPDLDIRIFDYGHSLEIARMRRVPEPLGINVEISPRPDLGVPKGYSVNLQIAKKMKNRGQFIEHVIEKLKDA